MSCTPLPELARGYQLRACPGRIRPDGSIYSFPLGPARTWRRRYPSPLGPGSVTWPVELCFWYPADPG